MHGQARSRRIFLAGAGLLPAVFLRAAPASDRGWDALPAILDAIRPPQIPSRQFHLADYGAAAAGDWTDAFRRAIDACSREGGGRVVVPEGRFQSGPIHLKRSVELYLSPQAVIRFANVAGAPAVLTRRRGVEETAASPFLYALSQENIAVTGTGTIEHAGAEGPADLLHFYRCRNVALEGVTFRTGQTYCVHPAVCANVTIRNLKIEAGADGGGLMAEACDGVLVRNAAFRTGGDCLAILAGGALVVQDSALGSAHGSTLAVAGGARGVFVRNCTFSGGRHGISIGAGASEVFCRGVSLGENSGAAIRIGRDGEPGAIHDLWFETIYGMASGSALDIQGLENAPVTNIHLRECSFDGAREPSRFRHARGLVFENVRVNGKFVSPPSPDFAKLYPSPPL